jgi:hypothetical protein
VGGCFTLTGMIGPEHSEYLCQFGALHGAKLNHSGVLNSGREACSGGLGALIRSLHL